MKVVFVQEFFGPQHGIMYISSILKYYGHECDVFIAGLEKDVVRSVYDAQPDLVGFSCITGFHNWVEKMAINIKSVLNKIPIIVGGPHPTYFPEMINSEGIDIICIGEGEDAIIELAERIQRGEDYSNIKNLWVKKDGEVKKNPIGPLIEDLDSLPFPDHKIYHKYPYFMKSTEVPVSISRGCPYGCYFCYNAAKKRLYASSKKYVRWRSVEKVIAELQMLKKEYPHMKSVIISDDIIGFNKTWITEFSKEYREKINLPFFASIRADIADEYTITKLKEANCFCLSIGVETGNEDMRRNILGKNIKNSTLIEAGKLIKGAGIKLRTSNMFFLPSETIGDAFETVKINILMKTDYPWAYILQPYPKTRVYEYAMENKFLNESYSIDDIDPLGLIENPIKLKDDKKIWVIQRLFYYAVKIPGFIYLLKALVYIPKNFIFDFLQRLAILISYGSYHQVSIFRALRVALEAQKYLKTGK